MVTALVKTRLLTPRPCKAHDLSPHSYLVPPLSVGGAPGAWHRGNGAPGRARTIFRPRSFFRRLQTTGGPDVDKRRHEDVCEECARGP